MNILDIVLIVVLLFSGWRGYRQGLVGQLVRIVSMIASFLVAFLCYRPVAVRLAEWFPFAKAEVNGTFSEVAGFPFIQQAIYNVAAFVLLALATGLAVRFVGGFLDSAAQLPGLSVVNNLAGGVIGLVKNGLILFVLLIVASLLPVEAVQETINGSLLASYATSYSSDLFQWIKEMIQSPLSTGRSSNLL
ncbi:CvpA family protein [Aneurinibacillus thermoaerophilus]|uniref:CvpA family protein n=1 Tax=Aneurinibacillus thermoaerophilus TaxID=143495 RepID=UPI002E220434|nr:CvpA family protein [Aneurinibacillus thermoaerophilus]